MASLPSTRALRGCCIRSTRESLIFLSLALLSCSTPVFTAHLQAQAEKPNRKVVQRVNPDYPETLRSAHIGGVVRLIATVDPNGTVKHVEIRGGNPILAERAQAAIMRWKYAPAPTQTTEEVKATFDPY